MSNWHNLPINDIEALVILDALSIMVRHPDKHPDDKKIAERIRNSILLMIKTDKDTNDEVAKHSYAYRMKEKERAMGELQ